MYQNAGQSQAQDASAGQQQQNPSSSGSDEVTDVDFEEVK
jgi:hypothetical protein